MDTTPQTCFVGLSVMFFFGIYIFNPTSFSSCSKLNLSTSTQVYFVAALSSEVVQGCRLPLTQGMAAFTIAHPEQAYSGVTYCELLSLLRRRLGDSTASLVVSTAFRR